MDILIIINSILTLKMVPAIIITIVIFVVVKMAVVLPEDDAIIFPKAAQGI